MKAVGKTTFGDMPQHLQKSLALEEILNSTNKAEQDNKNSIVWKFGRTTHFTYGFVSPILSNYRSASGVESTELLIADPPWLDVDDCRDIFSADGDSGSLAWDSEGHVYGMLWGGKEADFVTYITPIEYVFEDIRRVCSAKEVSLVE